MTADAGRHLPMGDGPEFDAIRRLLQVWGAAAHGVGDDAAVLQVPAGERLVASTDASVEGSHFRRAWMTPEEIGARAAAAALSDLAAMAATPLGLLLAISAPPNWRDELDAVARGVGTVAARARCPIVGGNMAGGLELSLTLTVLGTSAAPLSRGGARPGDALYVTGRLGGPRAALDSLLAGAEPLAAHRARFVAPEPRLNEALWLAREGARAAIDISDGLLADAGHLARASGVTLRLDLERIPLVERVDAELAVASGEEYELLVAMPAGAEVDAGEFRARFGLPLTRVGEVLERGREAVVVPGLRDGLAPGHDHFASPARQRVDPAVSGTHY